MTRGNMNGYILSGVVIQFKKDTYQMHWIGGCSLKSESHYTWQSGSYFYIYKYSQIASQKGMDKNTHQQLEKAFNSTLLLSFSALVILFSRSAALAI